MAKETVKETVKEVVEKVYKIGLEVEQTAAFSKRTLFLDFITREVLNLVAEHDIKHVAITLKDTKASDWIVIITELLSRGLWVSLKYQIDLHEKVLKEIPDNIMKSKHFVPVVLCKVVDLATTSENLAVSFVDADPHTNQGTWTWGAYQITDNNRLTEWKDYASIQSHKLGKK